MNIWERIVERKIQVAIESGDPDHLLPKGQPLRLDDESLIPHEWRLAYRILRNARLLPDWIPLDRGIADVVESARATLTRSAAESEAPQACVGEAGEFEASIELANRMMDVFSLKVPIARLRRGRLDAGAERAKVSEEKRKKAGPQAGGFDRAGS